MKQIAGEFLEIEITDATRKNMDNTLSFGGVGSYFKGKDEIDFDGVYTFGLKQMPNMGRYDVSWQHRLFHQHHPEWELGSFVNSVVEYNGRWMQMMPIQHQTTLGLQWVSPQLIVEGGYIQDLNLRHDKRFLLGARIHV